MNQAASFGLLAVGGVAVVKALTGSSWSDVVKGTPGAVASTGSSLTSAGVAAVPATAAKAGKAAAAAAPSSSSSSGGIGDVTAGDLASVAKAHHWDAAEITAWVAVIAKESGGILTAKNASSGAYGIAQGITGPGWYAGYGGNSTTVIGQLTSMGNYIAERYGTPTAALAHENSAGWY